MAMTAQLKASFSDEERAAAAAIGTTGDAVLDDRIQEVFRTLGDPLLSAEDTAALLVMQDQGAVAGAMKQLVAAGVLESSEKTQRPLDEEDVELFRLADVASQRLKLTALEARLPGSDRSLFQWTGDGRMVRSIARVSRLDAISGEGNQRKEIKEHVRKIAAGIESGAQVPNSLLLVFLDGSVTYEDQIESEEDVPESNIRIKPLSTYFTASATGGAGGHSLQQVRVVELDFPYRRAAFDEEKAILLVDGQQRTAGLSLVPVDTVPRFDFPVNAVVADEDEAKAVFSLANDTRRINADFKRALGAAMDEAPPFLRIERVPAEISKMLALTDVASPFRGIVRYPGLKQEKAHVVAYNTVFLVAKEFNESNLLDEDQKENPEVLEPVIRRAYQLVRDTWPTAWGKRPGESRLMHGAGLRAIASLLIEVLDGLEKEGHKLDADETWSKVKRQLALLKERVVWTDEEAADAPKTVRAFYENEIAEAQNTGKSILKLRKKLSKVLKEALIGQPIA